MLRRVGERPVGDLAAEREAARAAAVERLDERERREALERRALGVGEGKGRDPATLPQPAARVTTNIAAAPATVSAIVTPDERARCACGSTSAAPM